MRSLSVTERRHNEDMPAIFDRILPLNVVANTAIFYLAARLYLWPQLPRLRPQQILIPILLLHSTRHLGMMFLARGATYPGLSPEFAYPAAFGDQTFLVFRKGVVWITVQPMLTWLGRSYDRMAAGMRVFAGVPIR
jgi:hypothetical protein